ncbi:hypothetical protein M514_01651 [Trichuris suis]|uniref:Peptidase S1 domain-containing protein n=1 Tax=Trichuris suis TaxID=68888 RepID=A0A085N5U3_9BILA|nr:hypothetical protein M514_01651 [Trichuris suis]
MDLRQGTLLAIAYTLCLLINYSEETCGRPFYKPLLTPKRGDGNRITNGIEAREHSHPWQALVFTTMQGYRKRCGGSLIHWKDGNTSDLVLTAAHCVVDTSDFDTLQLWEKVRYSFSRLVNREMYNGPLVNASDVHVYLGAHDVRLLPYSSEHISVKEIAIGEFNKVRDVEDIALLKLQKVVTYGKFIQGICLPNEDEKELPIHSHCLVAGWGLAADGKPAARLQQVDAFIYEGRVNCSFFYKDRMICARGRTNSCGPEEERCGRPFYKPVLPSVSRAGNRISNGIEARKHSHPWQALVITHERGAVKRCGGSLIHWKEANSSDLILTAAHCVIDVSDFNSTSMWEEMTYFFRRLFNSHQKNGPLAKPSDVHVYLGAHDVDQLDYSTERIGVKEIFAGEFNKVSSIEDLTILRLEKEVAYNKFIQGICLPAENEKEPPKESSCVVTGWGLLADGKSATKLQQIDAYIFDGEISSDFFHKDQMICALGGGKDTGPDSVRGDILSFIYQPPIINIIPVTPANFRQYLLSYIHYLNSSRKMLFQAEMFYENRYSLLIVISLEFLLFQSSEEICGQPYYKPFIPSSRLSNRITNGVEVRKHSHPWQALVHKKFDHGHLGICGGSLIHWKESNASDLVLTAAHCVFNGDTSEQATPWKMITNVFSSVFGGHESKLITNVTDVLVYLGVHDTELFDSKVKRFRVAAMAIGDFDAKSKAHDIALLKLENKATYNEFIQGVCLPTQDENLPDAPRYCMVAGWGLLDDGTLGTKLQQVKAYIYEDVVYQSTFHKSRMICTDSSKRKAGAREFQYLKSAPKLLFRVEMFYENTCALLIVISLECLLFHGTEEICGQPHYKPILPTNDTVGNRIANGIEARRHSHPWQALVYKLVGEEQRICGGSLIHWQEQNASDLVLTAAHCVLHGYDSNGTTPWQIVTYAFTKIFNGQESKLITNVTDVEVYLGMHSITRVSSYAKRYRVAAMMVGEFNKINKPHDIAVLKLDSKATYNRFIQGICLPTEDENLPALSSQCLVVGWGLLDRNAYSDMRKVLLLIICANLLCRDSEEFCGQPVVKPILSTKDQAANRISNGIEVRMHSHPWQALILIKDLAADMLCGGSLMHWNHENASEFILTAAHCLVNWVRYRKERTAQEKTEGPSLSKRYESYPLVNVSDVIVYLGLHDIKQPTSAMKKLRITAMAVAQFDVYNRTDDIALLKLEKEITYSAEIQGICLPTKDEVLPPESLCLVAGWGRLRDGERGTKLQQFQTHIIIGKVNNSHYQEDLMICTGSKTRNTGARKSQYLYYLNTVLKLDLKIAFAGRKMYFDMRKVLLLIICANLLLRVSEAFCGRPFFKPIFSTEGPAGNRISNGIEARTHSHPWQALILIKDPQTIGLCGGSLIHWKHENASDVILTAAHCLIDWVRYHKEKTTWQKMKQFFNRVFKRRQRPPFTNLDYLIVYLGLHDINRPTSVLQRLRASAMAAAEFDVPKKTDDIALIKLEKEVTYNVAIQGVCLPAENEGLPPPESPCLVAGWGRLRDGKHGTKLQQFQTYIIDGKVNNPFFQQDLMICTGSKVKDTGARKARKQILLIVT